MGVYVCESVQLCACGKKKKHQGRCAQGERAPAVGKSTKWCVWGGGKDTLCVLEKKNTNQGRCGQGERAPAVGKSWARGENLKISRSLLLVQGPLWRIHRSLLLVAQYICTKSIK